jgi:hypothetical protein
MAAECPPSPTVQSQYTPRLAGARNAIASSNRTGAWLASRASSAVIDFEVSVQTVKTLRLNPVGEVKRLLM